MTSGQISPHTILIAQVAVSLVLVGLILTVQLVHYPLFAKVGAEGFAAYEAEHARRITWLVLPLMTSQLTLAVWLAIGATPIVPRWSTWLGLALLAGIWLSTLLVQVPQHAVLARGFDARAHAALVAGNWIRTGCWLARGGLSVWWLLAFRGARELSLTFTIGVDDYPPGSFTDRVPAANKVFHGIGGPPMTFAPRTCGC